MNVFNQEIMMRTAMGEARGEGALGMQAVMWTGMNRFTAKKWFSGHTVAGTFLKPTQYDCWMTHDPNYTLITNLASEQVDDPNHDLAKQAYQWAGDVLLGRLPDPTLGATHYYDDSIKPPAWAETGTKTVKIGRLTFYKDVA